MKLGRRPRNALRLSVLAVRSGKKSPRIRDVDRVRFGAVEGQNQACTAQADADTEVIVPGIPVQFTGSKGTSDPDRDELTYSWDFGDGTTSTDADPQHTYGDGRASVTATLTVSDGQSSCTSNVELQAVPTLDPGKTPGALFVAERRPRSSSRPSRWARPAPRRSRSATPTRPSTSQVKLRVRHDRRPASSSRKRAVTLGPGEAHEVTLTFAPHADGAPARARSSIVANASNRAGGELPRARLRRRRRRAPARRFAADPVFFTEIAAAARPRHVRLHARRTHASSPTTASTPASCPATASARATSASPTRTARPTAARAPRRRPASRAPNAGQPCTVPADCPGSYCPSYSLFDPVDLCSDGKSLFLISDEGTFTRARSERRDRACRDAHAHGPRRRRQRHQARASSAARRPRPRTSRATASRRARAARSTSPSSTTCPTRARASAPSARRCVKIAQGNGSTQVVTGRIDAYEGLGDCDDLDPVDAARGRRATARRCSPGFESGGLWQIRPSPIFYSADITELVPAPSRRQRALRGRRPTAARPAS